MIQRIQSLFFLFAAILTLGLLFIPFWSFTDGSSTQNLQALSIEVSGTTSTPTLIPFSEHILHTVFFGLSLLIPILLLVTIFLFGNRPRQVRIAYLALFLTLIEIVVMIFFSRQGPFEDLAAGEGVVQLGLALPMVSLVLIWLGIKRVQADEELVRSVDRIR